MAGDFVLDDDFRRSVTEKICKVIKRGDESIARMWKEIKEEIKKVGEKSVNQIRESARKAAEAIRRVWIYLEYKK